MKGYAKHLLVAILIIFGGNIGAYWLYEVILKGGAWDQNILSPEFLLKAFRFPAAALLILLTFLLIEHRRNGVEKSTLGRLIRPDIDNSTKEDLTYSVLGLASITRILSLLFSFGIGFGLNNLIERYLNVSLLSDAPVVAQVIAVFLIIPLSEYWHHRLMHTASLWDIHAVHHSANHFNGLTTFRVHPLDSALAGPFRALPVALLGIRPDLVAFYSLVNLGYQVWVHSDIYIDYPWLRRYLIIDPSLHRIHHSSESRYYDKNFGILTIYDRLFGTWEDIKGKPENIPIGFKDHPLHNQGKPVSTMFRVFRDWITRRFRHREK